MPPKLTPRSYRAIQNALASAYIYAQCQDGCGLDLIHEIIQTESANIVAAGLDYAQNLILTNEEQEATEDSSTEDDDSEEEVIVELESGNDWNDRIEESDAVN